MEILLTRKFANCLDGIDLSDCQVGDVIEVPEPHANLLIAEGWALPVSRHAARTKKGERSAPLPRARAADEPTRAERTIKQLRAAREQMEQRVLEYRERRRIEDQIREELRDARAKTISNG
jgi:hypothetical protein